MDDDEVERGDHDYIDTANSLVIGGRDLFDSNARR